MHLYLRSTSGISGDMLVGAFLGLGLPWEHLLNQLKRLPLTGWQVEQKPVLKQDVEAVQFQVHWDEQSQHRHLRDILRLLEQSSLEPRVRAIAEDLFQALGRAEAEVHQVPLEAVHFHEVGAIDTILDIVAIAVALDHFQIESVTASPLVEGVGEVSFSHGRCELPVPAVRQLLTGAPLQRIPLASELITPTGAVFVQRWVAHFCEISPLLQPCKGVGCGTKNFAHPNVLELEMSERRLEPEPLLRLETHVDDISPQHLATCLKEALNLGALDAWGSPIWGKKGRIGQQLVVLCQEATRDRMLELLLRHSGSFGVRVLPIWRLKLQSEHQTSLHDGSEVSLRSGWVGDECWQWKPEHDQIEALANAQGESTLWVETQVRQAWGAELLRRGRT